MGCKHERTHVFWAPLYIVARPISHKYLAKKRYSTPIYRGTPRQSEVFGQKEVQYPYLSWHAPSVMNMLAKKRYSTVPLHIVARSVNQKCLVAQKRQYFFSFLFFFPSHLLSSPFYHLSLLVVTQIRGHVAGSSPPVPTTVRALHLLSREDFSSFLPRRLASNCAYPR